MSTTPTPDFVKGYQTGFEDGKAGKASAYPVATPPEPAPVIPPVAPVTPPPAPTPAPTPVPSPPPIIVVGTQSLDPLITAANAGDAATIARLAAGLSGTWKLNATANLNRANLYVKFLSGATLVPNPWDSTSNHGGNVWVANAPGCTVDGATVMTKCGIYFQAFADKCTLKNLTINTAYQIARTNGLANTGVTSGGTNMTVDNVTHTGTTDSCTFWFDRNGFLLKDSVSLQGSVGEILIRIDEPTLFGNPTGTISGGKYWNQANAYEKATLAGRIAGTIANPVLVTGVILHGNNGGGESQWPSGTPLPPGGKVTAGWFANMNFVNCQFYDMMRTDPKPNDDFPFISVEQGAIVTMTACDFFGTGPYPHRFPISLDSRGNSTFHGTGCLNNPPEPGASGGTFGTAARPAILQPNHSALAAETDCRYWG
jgi:hypothetical protein